MIAIGPDRFRSKAAASPESGEGSGGDMDDVSIRLSAVEAGVADVRKEVADIRKDLTETRKDVANLREQFAEMRAEVRIELRQCATKADLEKAIGLVRADMHREIGTLAVAIGGIEARLIKWMLGFLMAAAVLALGIARLFGHA
jgi:hypothetical protein